MPDGGPQGVEGVAFERRWTSWTGHTVEELHLRFENNGWTADGAITLANADGVHHHYAHYVVRTDASFAVRQMLLFRDLDEPDLWLATDGAGRWGEVNGSWRDDLNGCTDVDVPCTPFTRSVPLRRLQLAVGESAEVDAATIDVDTLGITPVRHRYTRVSEHRYRHESVTSGVTTEIELDDDQLVVEVAHTFRLA